MVKCIGTIWMQNDDIVTKNEQKVSFKTMGIFQKYNYFQNLRLANWTLMIWLLEIVILNMFSFQMSENRIGVGL